MRVVLSRYSTCTIAQQDLPPAGPCSVCSSLLTGTFEMWLCSCCQQQRSPQAEGRQVTVLWQAQQEGVAYTLLAVKWYSTRRFHDAEVHVCISKLVVVNKDFEQFGFRNRNWSSGTSSQAGTGFPWGEIRGHLSRWYNGW